MDKNAIKKFAVWARRELIEKVAQKALQYEIEDAKELNSNLESINGKLLTETEKQQRKTLITKIKEEGYNQVIEEVAYTWFNRFIALRFMEVNGFLPSHVRVFTDENDNFKPQILSEALHLEFASLDKEQVISMKQDNKDEELFKYLLITQCNELNALLPNMFQRLSDYTELLLPDYLLREGSVIEKMVDSIEANEWTDQVEIIGWLYQYYNAELKDQAFEELKTKGVIVKDNIPAATQLFTPDWIVKYMVDNSLGFLWNTSHESQAIDLSYGVAEGEKDVESKLVCELKNANILPEEITVYDPCMGSGHVLCYVFDLLIKIYEAYGYSARESVSTIVEKNIYGTDIDKRAAQLAYFAIMMKARQYDRRFFSHVVSPNVYEISGLDSVDYNIVDYFNGNRSELVEEYGKLKVLLNGAKEYGSLITTESINYDLLFERLDEIEQDNTLWNLGVNYELKRTIKASSLLGKKYDAVITNPPYMGNKGFSKELLNFITKHYYEGKIDLYAAFILRCAQYTKKNRIFSMVTPESWMFLSRFKKLREPFLNCNTLTSLLHLGFGAFDSGFGTVAFTACNHSDKLYKAACYRLVDEGTSEEKEKAFFNKKPSFANESVYEIVEGSPICYWVSDSMLNNFKNKKIKDYGKTCVGLLTGNNERFLRYWFEINYDELGIRYTHEQARKDISKKWFPINQYGEYRKWYGNNMIVFDWWNDGFNIKKFKMDRYLAGEAEKKNSMCWNEDSYFCSGVTWNRISTNKFSARMSPIGNTAGSSSPIYFPEERKYFFLGLFNSKVFSSIVAFLNPTVSFQTTDIEKVPVVFGDTQIDDLAKENEQLAKEDWDSFETSYDFVRNPLV